MRYTVEKQWAVIDGQRGRVIETFETEGDAYRAAYKKEAASQKRDKAKRAKSRAAGWATRNDPKLNDSVTDLGKGPGGLLPIEG